jgi:hypothetical protein
MNEDTGDTWTPLSAAVEQVLARTRALLEQRAGQNVISLLPRLRERRYGGSRLGLDRAAESAVEELPDHHQEFARLAARAFLHCEEVGHLDVLDAQSWLVPPSHEACGAGTAFRASPAFRRQPSGETRSGGRPAGDELRKGPALPAKVPPRDAIVSAVAKELFGARNKTP